MTTFAAEITPLILTKDEAPNIGRTLERLRWASRVVVVDSVSTDETKTICQSFPNVDVIERPFDTLATQCNAGIDHVRTPWVLSLDADYLITEELAREMATLVPEADVAGYEATFLYAVGGQTLRASLYPPRVVLFRRALGRYRQDGHAHRLELAGTVRPLSGRVVHDDRKSLSRWLVSQDAYAEQEARKLRETPRERLATIDRLRRSVWPAPIVVVLYTLFVKGLVFEGWRGWYYAAQRVTAELMLSMRLLEAKWKGDR